MANILEVHRMLGEGGLRQSRDVLWELDRRFGIANSLGRICNSVQAQSADARLLFEMALEQAADHSTVDEFVRSLAEKRELEENPPSIPDESKRDRIEVTTIHKAKGREWEHVVLFHPCLRVPPAFPAGTTRDEWTEEERRVFYVAVTRCQSRLLLTFGNDCPFAPEFLLNPKLERRKRHELMAEIGPLKQRLERMRAREQVLRGQCDDVNKRGTTDIARWRTDEETARSEANSILFDSETARRQLLDLLPLRTTLWKYLSRIGIYPRQEREMRWRIDSLKTRARSLCESAERLAKQQAKTKAEIDRLADEVKRIEGERASAEDAIDEIRSESCFRRVLGR